MTTEKTNLNKISSFELNFVEKNQNGTNNVDQEHLTDKSIDSSAKQISKLNSKSINNFRMGTIDENAINNKNLNQNFLSPNFPSLFNSPDLNAARQNYRNTTFRSSMELYRLKLSRSKLKAVTRTSALLSGFAMVAMVELGLDYSDYFEAMKQNELAKSTLSTTSQSKLVNSTLLNQTINNSFITTSTAITSSIELQKYLVPEPVLILYALVTCLLVGVHMLALMISTCILPQLEASSFDHIEFEQQLFKHEYNFMNQTHLFASQNKENKTRDDARINLIGNMDESFLSKKNGIFSDTDLIFPYKKFHRFIELAWLSSTVFGIFLFLVEIGLVCYIKFFPISFWAAFTGAIIMTPILILFVVFTFTFYKRLADFKVNITKHFLNQVDKNLLPLHDDIL